MVVLDDSVAYDSTIVDDDLPNALDLDSVLQLVECLVAYPEI